MPQLASLSAAAGMHSHAPLAGVAASHLAEAVNGTSSQKSDQGCDQPSKVQCQQVHLDVCCSCMCTRRQLPALTLPSASLAGLPSGLRLSTLLRLRFRLRREDSSLKVLAVGLSCGVCLAGPCCRLDPPRPGLLLPPPAGATAVACCVWPAEDTRSIQCCGETVACSLSTLLIGKVTGLRMCRCARRHSIPLGRLCWARPCLLQASCTAGEPDLSWQSSKKVVSHLPGPRGHHSACSFPFPELLSSSQAACDCTASTESHL